MPSIEYKTVYTADDSKAIASIDRIIGKLGQLDARVDASTAKLKKFAQDMPGVVAALSSLSNLTSAFGSVDKAADDAYDSVRRVGNDTGGMTRTATKATELHKRLKELEAQAAAVSAAIAGITPPSGGGGGGGQPGPGKGGGGGNARRGIVGSVGAHGLSFLQQIMRSATIGLGEAGQEARDFQGNVASQAMSFRDERRELAGLMGASTPDSGVVRSSLGLMRTSGMSSQEEAQFSTEYYNSAALGRDKGNLGAAGANRDKLEQDIRVMGAQFAVRRGLAANAAGDLTGIVSAYKKVGTARDVAGEIAGMEYGLDQGRGNMTSLIRSELSQAGSKITTGRVADLPELGAMIGVLSGTAKSGASTGTNYGQLSRLLNEATGKEADFLKRAGVADVKGDLAKLHTLDAYFKKNNIADPRTHLAEQGFGNELDLNATTFALSQLPVIDQRVAEARKRQSNPDAFLQANAEFQRSGLGYSRRISAETEAGEIERGIQDEARTNLRRQGHSLRLTHPMVTPKAGTHEGNARAKWLEFTNTGGFGSFNGEQEMDEQEGIASLRVRAAAVGLDIQKKYPDLMKEQGMPWFWQAGSLFSGGRTRNTDNVRNTQIAQATAEVEQLEKAAREQQNAAGNLNQAAAALNNAAAALAQGGNGAQLPPAPLPGKPAVAPKRP